MGTMRTIIRACWSAALLTCLRAEDVKIQPAGPTPEDILVLLETSWAKVRITGKAWSEFELALTLENGQPTRRLMAFTMFPTEHGELCLMSKDSKGIGIHKRDLPITFNWTNGGASKWGKSTLERPWNYKSGAVFTNDIGPSQTFHSAAFDWDMEKDSLLVISQIFWAPKPPTLKDETSSYKRLGKFVLRRIESRADMPK